MSYYIIRTANYLFPYLWTDKKKKKMIILRVVRFVYEMQLSRMLDLYGRCRSDDELKLNLYIIYIYIYR